MILPCTLESLSLWKNQIKWIDLRGLTHLEHLDLGGNQLTRFPKLDQQCRLSGISLDGNPLVLPTVDIRTVSADRVCAAYFSKNREKCSIICTTALFEAKAMPFEITMSNMSKINRGYWSHFESLY